MTDSPINSIVNPMSRSEEALRKTIAAYPRDLSGFSRDNSARLRLTVLVDDLNVILGDLDAYRRTLAAIADAPDLRALLVEAGEFIQPFNAAADLSDRIEAALAKALGK